MAEITVWEGQVWRRAVDKGRWVGARWLTKAEDPAWALQLSVDMEPWRENRPSGASIGVVGMRADYQDLGQARGPAHTLITGVVRQMVLARCEDPTEEDKQRAKDWAERAGEAVAALILPPVTEEERALAAARWGLNDPHLFEVDLALAVETAVPVAAEALAGIDPSLSADLAAVGRWLRGETLAWPKVCQGCGISFIPRQQNQVFHNVQCGRKERLREWRKKKREKSS